MFQGERFIVTQLLGNIVVIMPIEKTSRRPPTANERERNPSSATMRHMRGKSVKLVLADRARTASALASAR